MNDSVPGEREIWYRYHDFRVGESTRIQIEEYEVIRHTPCGVWLRPTRDWFSTVEDRFVLTSARKRFACPTRKEAWESFVARKRRQVVILTHQLRHAQDALVAAGAAQPEYVESF